MSEDVQPSLFPDQEPSQDETVVTDISERIAHIGQHARPYEPVDRTSEAAKDQGWGTHEPASVEHVPGTAEERQSARQQSQHPAGRKFELPGKGRGRSNTPGLATPKEAQARMTSEEVEVQRGINSRAAAAAREVIKNSVTKPGT